MHEAFRWMFNGLWAVTGHADVVDVERRTKDFSSALGYRSSHSPGEDNMIASDDPQHGAQRDLVARRFTPKAVLAQEHRIRSTVVELLDAVIGAQRMEVVSDLAAPLPCRLTAALLGFRRSAGPTSGRARRGTGAMTSEVIAGRRWQP